MKNKYSNILREVNDHLRQTSNIHNTAFTGFVVHQTDKAGDDYINKLREEQIQRLDLLKNKVQLMKQVHALCQALQPSSEPNSDTAANSLELCVGELRKQIRNIK